MGEKPRQHQEADRCLLAAQLQGQDALQLMVDPGAGVLVPMAQHCRPQCRCAAGWVPSPAGLLSPAHHRLPSQLRPPLCLTLIQREVQFCTPGITRSRPALEFARVHCMWGSVCKYCKFWRMQQANRRAWKAHLTAVLCCCASLLRALGGVLCAFSSHCPPLRANRGDREELRFDFGVSLSNSGTSLLGGPRAPLLPPLSTFPAGKASADDDTRGFALLSGSAPKRRTPFLPCSNLMRMLPCLCAAGPPVLLNCWDEGDLGDLMALGDARLDPSHCCGAACACCRVGSPPLLTLLVPHPLDVSPLEAAGIVAAGPCCALSLDIAPFSAAASLPAGHMASLYFSVLSQAARSSWKKQNKNRNVAFAPLCRECKNQATHNLYLDAGFQVEDTDMDAMFTNSANSTTWEGRGKGQE